MNQQSLDNMEAYNGDRKEWKFVQTHIYLQDKFTEFKVKLQVYLQRLQFAAICGISYNIF